MSYWRHQCGRFPWGRPCGPGQADDGRGASGSRAGRLLVYRGLVDLLDRRLELGVELLVALAIGQPFEKRTGEAGDEGGVACQQGTGLVTAVAARQGEDPQDPRVSRQVAIQADLGRDGA